MAALVLATTLLWAAGAQSKPGSKPVPEDRIAEVQILGLNETHGQLVPLSERNADGSRTAVGGAAALGTYLDREEAENPLRTLTVDSGDFMQGPAISSYFEGKSTVEVYNEIGVDSVAVGNHEFDWGRDALNQRIAEARFPFLANNIIEDATGKQPAGIAPYKVFKRDGLKIGVIGVGNPDTKNVTLPEATEGLSFLDLQKTATEVAGSVKELKAAKVETVVLTPHMGLETATEGPLADLLKALPAETADELDFALGGHIPLDITTEVNGVPVVQPLGNTRGYADATLTVDRRTGDVTKYAATSDRVLTDSVPPDPAVKAIVDRYQVELQAALGETVGESTTSILRGATRTVESEMGNFVADSMRTYYPEVDFAFQNAGGLRADIDQGPITLEEVYAVLPFNNTLVTMNLTGAQVEQVLEEGANSQYGTVQVSGLTWAYDADAPFGDRVTRVTLPDGTPIDPNATYKIATNNFMATGGDQFITLTKGTNTTDTQTNLVDTVVRYLELNSPVDPQVEGRLTVE
ncbi:MAG: 5'-nucleotidase C-terminal domain-containing protein [Rubrobacteraceae bacterium]|nr:5'-nucleotidase C-terminal domain-containing protein [Rubrobacteraceae bacterium]